MSATAQPGFDQLWERVRQMRARPAFHVLRATLPPLTPSQYDPMRPTLSDEDRLERWLLSLDDETYERITKPQATIRENAPSDTGDAIVDQWEREFWARQRGE